MSSRWRCVLAPNPQFHPRRGEVSAYVGSIKASSTESNSAKAPAGGRAWSERPSESRSTPRDEARSAPGIEPRVSRSKTDGRAADARLRLLVRGALRGAHALGLGAHVGGRSACHVRLMSLRVPSEREARIVSRSSSSSTNSLALEVTLYLIPRSCASTLQPGLPGGLLQECRAMFPVENSKPQSAARKTTGHRRARPPGRNAASSNPHPRTDLIAVHRCSL